MLQKVNKNYGSTECDLPLLTKFLNHSREVALGGSSFSNNNTSPILPNSIKP